MNKITPEKYIKYIFSKIDHYNLSEIFKHDEQTCLEILLEALELMIENMENNILQIMYQDIDDELFYYSYDIQYYNYVEDVELGLLGLNFDKKKDFIYNINKLAKSIIFKYFIPKRSYKGTFIRRNTKNISVNIDNYDKINKNIEYLKNVKQPEQRSDEWYLFRSSTLTASNIYKIFTSISNQNQLIIEKCEPININKYKVNNLNGPLHWGQKYEPISIMYYELINNTKVEEFGCIPHREYPFIAASPDGIVCDKNSELFGRMLEIKNPFTRIITGIPKHEYWIQMQLQMEVCGLNECDFLETKIEEYIDYEEFLSDKVTEYKGIILQYMRGDSPIYLYAPINITDFDSEEYASWFNSEKEKVDNSLVDENDMSDIIEFNRYIYWKITHVSCVLVLRNRFWFDNVLPYIEKFWNIVLDERIDDKYKERIKKRRKLEFDDLKRDQGFYNTGCLVNMNMQVDNNINNTINKVIDLSLNNEVLSNDNMIEDTLKHSHNDNNLDKDKDIVKQEKNNKTDSKRKHNKSDFVINIDTEKL